MTIGLLVRGPAPAAAAGRDRPWRDPLPRWLWTTVTVVVCVMLGYALSAMPLAMAGALRPVPTLLLTILVTAGLLWLARGLRAPAGTTRTGPAAPGAVIAAVGIVALGNDALSPLLNLGWLAVALLSAWCLGRPWRVETETLQTLLTGAITFETPPAAMVATESPPDSRFVLYRDRKSAGDSADPVRVFYQVSFPGELHGLAIGTPVELRGIPIGRVSALRLEYDPASDEIRVPATLEIAPHRIIVQGAEAIPRDDEQALKQATNQLFEKLIAKGLRARLAPDNLLIGSRLVDLDFVDNPDPAQLVYAEPYPELPAVGGSGLGEVARSATAFLDKLATLPLGELVGGLRDMVRHADTVVASPELKRSVQQLDRTLADAGRFARDIRVQAGPLLTKLNSAADQLGTTLADDSQLGLFYSAPARVSYPIGRFRFAVRLAPGWAAVDMSHSEATPSTTLRYYERNRFRLEQGLEAAYGF